MPTCRLFLVSRDYTDEVIAGPSITWVGYVVLAEASLMGRSWQTEYELTVARP